MTAPRRPRILIVGGGYVGLYAALRLERRLGRGEAEVTLVSPENYMTYQPLLPELAGGTLEPRHVAIPIRKALKRTRVLTGRLIKLDHERRVASVEPYEGEELALSYDHVVLGLGATSRFLPVPGLAEHAIGFQTLPESLHLRDVVLERMEAAEASSDPGFRRRALTFVVVGGGYTGVEALAELEDMARGVCRHFPSISPRDLRWMLIEATDRILTTVPRDLAEYAVVLLRARDIDVRLETTLESVEDGRLTLSTGETVAADTLVWAAGVVPNPLVGQLGLPLTDDGFVEVDPELRVCGVEGAWAAGDCAGVPDLVAGGLCPATAQYAERQAKHLGDNLAAVVKRRPPTPFRYASKGQFLTLGRHKAVAAIGDREFTGLPVWLARRVYYALHIPTLDRKLWLLLSWVLDAVFRHDVVQLGSARRPYEAFQAAARQGEAA